MKQSLFSACVLLIFKQKTLFDPEQILTQSSAATTSSNQQVHTSFFIQKVPNAHSVTHINIGP